MRGLMLAALLGAAAAQYNRRIGLCDAGTPDDLTLNPEERILVATNLNTTNYPVDAWCPIRLLAPEGYTLTARLLTHNLASNSHFFIRRDEKLDKALLFRSNSGSRTAAELAAFGNFTSTGLWVGLDAYASVASGVSMAVTAVRSPGVPFRNTELPASMTTGTGAFINLCVSGGWAATQYLKPGTTYTVRTNAAGTQTPNNAACTLSLRAPPGYDLEAKFTELSTGSGNDWVGQQSSQFGGRAWTGSNSYSGFFMASTVPALSASNGNGLDLYYWSDASGTSSGVAWTVTLKPSRSFALCLPNLRSGYNTTDIIFNMTAVTGVNGSYTVGFSDRQLEREALVGTECSILFNAPAGYLVRATVTNAFANHLGSAWLHARDASDDTLLLAVSAPQVGVNRTAVARSLRVSLEKVFGVIRSPRITVEVIPAPTPANTPTRRAPELVVEGSVTYMPLCAGPSAMFNATKQLAAGTYMLRTQPPSQAEYRPNVTCAASFAAAGSNAIHTSVTSFKTETWYDGLGVWVDGALLQNPDTDLAYFGDFDPPLDLPPTKAGGRLDLAFVSDDTVEFSGITLQVVVGPPSATPTPTPTPSNTPSGTPTPSITPSATRSQGLPATLNRNMCDMSGTALTLLDKQMVFVSTSADGTEYPNSADCQFTVNAPAGKVLFARFISFETEYDYDFFEVLTGATSLFYGSGETDEERGPQADISKPFTRLSTLTFKFTSDENTVAAGVRLVVEVVDIPPTASPTASATRTPSATVTRTPSPSFGAAVRKFMCGADNGAELVMQQSFADVTVATNAAGGFYPNSAACTMRIVAPSASWNVAVSFVSFNTESGYDHYFILAGDGKEVLKASGSTIPLGGPFIDSALTLKLTSDSGFTTSGVVVRITLVPRSPTPTPSQTPSVTGTSTSTPTPSPLPPNTRFSMCDGSNNGTIRAGLGVTYQWQRGDVLRVQTQVAPLYPNRRTCIFSAQAPPGTQLKVVLVDRVDVLAGDELSVYSTLSAGGDQKLASWWNLRDQRPEPAAFSVNNTLSLKLYTDSSNQGKGAVFLITADEITPSGTPSASASPAPPSASPLPPNFQYQLCATSVVNGVRGGNGVTHSMARGDVIRLVTQTAATYPASRSCVFSVRGLPGSTLKAVVVGPVDIAAGDSFAIKPTLGGAGDETAVSVVGGVDPRNVELNPPFFTFGETMSVILTTDASQAGAGATVLITADVPSQTPTPTRTPTPTKALPPSASPLPPNFQYQLCATSVVNGVRGGNGVTHQFARGDVIRLVTQTGASYPASRSCVFSVQAPQGAQLKVAIVGLVDIAAGDDLAIKPALGGAGRTTSFSIDGDRPGGARSVVPQPSFFTVGNVLSVVLNTDASQNGAGATILITAHNMPSSTPTPSRTATRTATRTRRPRVLRRAQDGVQAAEEDQA